MTRMLPRSLFGRTVLVLVAGLVLVHVVSTVIHYGDRTHRMWLIGGEAMVHRVLAAHDALSAVPPAQRPALAAALSGPELAIALADGNGAPNEDGGWRATMVRERLAERLPAVAVAPCDDPACGEARLVVSATFADGMPVRFLAAASRTSTDLVNRIVLETVIMIGGIVVLSLWASGWLVRPLTAFARAADRLGRDIRAPGIDEAGPSEIRQAGRAFNRMQERLRRFVDDRTQMLAAISHDLRTPITRLRLRAELIDDEDQRFKTLADLDDMERMTDSALAFARDEASGEAPVRVDLTALIESVCHDAEDAGHLITCTGTAPAPIQGRPLALKRAFANLIDNAVKYGGGAEVAIGDTDEVRITVCDRGPGLAEAELEEAFKPFHRAASREVGGSGLGLALARSIFRGHGGEVRLENRPGGGLCAVVTLPR